MKSLLWLHLEYLIATAKSQRREGRLRSKKNRAKRLAAAAVQRDNAGPTTSTRSVQMEPPNPGGKRLSSVTVSKREKLAPDNPSIRPINMTSVRCFRMRSRKRSGQPQTKPLCVIGIIITPSSHASGTCPVHPYARYCERQRAVDPADQVRASGLKLLIRDTGRTKP